ncbi:hypothetical protein HI914_05317 [Erysiphe necator]|nr:hypothetical protein HI914_05317 [Erysiphe necator]
MYSLYDEVIHPTRNYCVRSSSFCATNCEDTYRYHNRLMIIAIFTTLDINLRLMIHFIETAKFAMPATGHQAFSYTIFLYRFDAKTTCHTPFPPMLKIVLEMPTSEGKKTFITDSGSEPLPKLHVVSRIVTSTNI